MSTPLLTPAPTVANIDQDYLLLVNWQPLSVAGGYTIYSGWNILVANPPGNTPVTTFTDGLDSGGTLSSPSYEASLHAGDYTLDMVAISSDHGSYLDSPNWNAPHQFPPSLSGSMVSADNSTLLLGQTLTITLDNAYNGTGVSGWQVVYADGTSSGWLPMTNRVVTKIFNTPGQQKIVVYTQSDHSMDDPAVKLTRSFAFSVFVMNQQYSAAASTSITGTLGVGGESGFEIVDITSAATAPAPYEVIVRGLVRDTMTNELKLLVATSRYSNASSLMGTMALDVFPLSGRPQVSELLEPLTTITAALASSSPVKITTSALPSNASIGLSAEYFKFMAASGGTAPYSWFAQGLPTGLRMSIDGTISGTPTELGNFEVDFSVMDSSVPAFIAETTLLFTIPTNLVITTATLPSATVLVPYSVQMANGGGLLPFTWSIQGGALPIGVTLNQNTGLISGVPCTYSLQDFVGSLSVTIQVQDAVGALASRAYSLTLSPAALQLGLPDQPAIFAGHAFELEVPVFGGQSPYTLNSFTDDGTYALDPDPVRAPNSYALDGGQLELSITVPNTQANKTHSFTVTLHDSAATVISRTVYYTVNSEVSNILVPEAAIDWDWTSGDTASLIYPIDGDLGGFEINEGSAFTVPSGSFSQPIGLVVTVNPDIMVSPSPPMSPPVTGSAIEVAGPPSEFLNSEVRVSIPLTNGTSTMATISREFALLSRGSSVSIYTRPYIVGDFIALNPQRPYFNSPHVTNAVGTFVRVQYGSALPLGLSLDQDAGLVYGTLLGTYGSLAGGSNTSILEYIDSGDAIIETITVYWDTQSNGFSLSSSLSSGSLQKAYTGTITSTSPSDLDTASAYRGQIPAGLSLGVSGTSITLTGTPTEAGYFDLWIMATNADGNSAYIYQRLAITYATPLTILTSSLDAVVVGQAYSETMQGYGGIPDYTWSTASTLPTGITLSSGGVLAGSVGSGEGTNYPITFTLTDSAGTITTRALTLYINSSLVITTSVVGGITLAQAYSFQMHASGGVPPYTWTTTGGALPTSITISSAGVISGTTADSGYGTQSVTFKVTDSTAAFVTRALPVTVGVVAGMAINSSGVGAINRGSAYMGTLAVTGTYTVPVQWQVTPDSPHALPSGLTLTASVSDQGASARISGLYTGVAFTGDTVKVQAVDSAGHLATVTLSLSATTNLAITTTSPLPTAVVNIAYLPSGSSFQFHASGGGSSTGGTPAYTWSIPTPPGGFPFILTVGGVLQGTATLASTWTFTARVTDAMSPVDTANATFTITSSASTLAITTASPLPAATAGVAYPLASGTLAASGGTPSYTWTLVAGLLPSGLSLSSTGIISGTPLAGTYNFTVQVTDSLGSTSQKAFVLSSNVGLNLYSGIDYTNSISTNILGYVTSTGNVATVTGSNESFLVVATGVIATSPSQLGVTIPTGFSSVVQSITGGVALVKLNGPFSSATVGSHSFGMIVTDVGPVSASKSFTWTVYASGSPLYVTPSSGAVPSYGIPLLEGTAGHLPIYNTPGNAFNFQTYNSQSVDKIGAANSIFKLSGTNNNYQGRLSFGYDGTNFLYSYNGSTFDSSVALTPFTLLEEDIAWFGTLHGFDTFSTGVSQSGNFLYMVKPSVISVTPNPLTIPTTSTSTGTAGPNLPATEAAVASAFTAWYAVGNLHSGGADTITLYGDNDTVSTAQLLNLTNFLLPTIPANATISSVTVYANLQQSSGIAATYFGNKSGTAGVKLIGATAPVQTGMRLNAGNTFTFYPTGLTPAQANASSFGVAIQLNCTELSGSRAVLQLNRVSLMVTYTVPNYSQIVVTLNKPFSPQQQGVGAAGNSIAAPSVTMSNGVTVVSTTPNYSGGWLTGWTITAQFPSGSGTVVSALGMTVTGTLTYLNGTAITTGTVTYISGTVATITANRAGGGGGGGGGGGTLTMTTASLSAGQVGASYTMQMAATGGATPYAWSIIGGSLPNGISLNASTGLISGTPSVAGTFHITFQVTDSTAPTHQTATTSSLSLVISAGAPPALSITTTALNSALYGVSYSASLSATGGSGGYTWSITSGFLPAGMSLNSATGLISGSPGMRGLFNFVVKVRDSSSATATKSLSLNVMG